jgi:hypothetical protein
MRTRQHISRRNGTRSDLVPYQLCSPAAGRVLDVPGGKQAQDEQHQEDDDKDKEENTSDVRARC